MLWSDFATSNPRINFCSTISFILPSIFIFVVFILLDEFLLILSLNYTIRVFTLSNIVGRHWLMSLKVKAPEAMLQSFVLSISFENGFINSFVRISFILWTCISHLFISDDRKHFHWILWAFVRSCDFFQPSNIFSLTWST